MGENMEKRYMPVFKGGLFQNNEVILPYENFIFNSEEELKKADEENPFISFFPFPVIFCRVLESNVGDRLDGVEISLAGQPMLAISGEWYDGVD